MKPSLAHLSPTLPAVLATGAAVTLSVFLLAGAEPQGAPAPLLPAIGGAAVHVVANLPGTTHRASKDSTTPIAQTELATTSGQRAAPPHGATMSHASRPAHHARARVHRATPSPAQVASHTAPAPIVRRQTFQATPAPKGKARGHSHSHSHSHSHGGGRPAPAAAHVHVHGHGTVLGHTHHGAFGHSHHGTSRGSSHHGNLHGHADKTSGPSHPEHAAPTKTGSGPPTGHGGGNGHGGKQ
jgi:hypothetical protein